MGIERIRNPEQGGGALLDLGNVFHADSPTIFHMQFIYRVSEWTFWRIYSVQGVLAAYLDAEPDDISISGTLAETGVDETAVITFKYSDGRVGVAACNARAQLHNEGKFRDPRILLVLIGPDRSSVKSNQTFIIYLAHICGDGGIIKIIDFWCPEVIEVTRYRDTGKNAKEILPVGKS